MTKHVEYVGLEGGVGWGWGWGLGALVGTRVDLP
jgi:hypothetical protein